MKKVIVAEFGDSHTELLYSHQVILKRLGYQVVFFLNSKLEKKISSLFPDKIIFFEEKENKLKIAYQLFCYIRQEQVTLLIDNSAHSNYIRNLGLFTWTLPNFQIIGVCHYVDKLKESPTQRLISTFVKKYFILNQLFVENGTVQLDKSKAIFYSIFYEGYQEKGKLFHLPKLPIRVIIPGEVSRERKDFDTLLQVLHNNINLLQDKIHFICLGNASKSDGKSIQKIVKDLKIQCFFTFFDDFVPQTVFENILENAQLVMPLINPELPYHQDYFTSKISGAYNLAFGRHIPLLLHSVFSQFSDFQGVSIFYDNSELADKLFFITENIQNLESLQHSYTQKEHFTLSYQQEMYARFIEA